MSIKNKKTLNIDMCLNFADFNLVEKISVKKTNRKNSYWYFFFNYQNQHLLAYVYFLPPLQWWPISTGMLAQV